ncbi:acetyltransferase, including N-acetylase of ribosomal protein [Solibacillus silvestris StLB046]|uniref:Acetyltransferase, including N-acetylase of ribosomal protein n=1 Tax=Solibacillus silvestris (strain StLB046) TaxID=1002809 RepID=F2F5V4_SOLSS|nr:GNAT family protein [Solibacillus silvestris]BAK17037.1 acetyltransferase, including N-acetylase of ribosomal protein [Solibacillus silvestris StLB046]
MEEIIVENDIVKLRPVQMSDIEAIANAANDERIWEHMSVTLLTQEAVENYIENAIQEREKGISYMFVVIEKKTDNIVGCTSFLDISFPHKRLEIGATWYNPTVWRSAINTNCKFLLFQYCFEVLNLNRIQIKTGHENYRSQKAIERIGAIKEGVLRNHMIRKEGTIRHTIMYSVIVEDWEKLKTRFIDGLLK